VSSIEYQPFGESSTTGSEEDYQFAGKEKDASGLYYFGARYYDPQVGRFTTKDPLPGRIQSPQTLNRYVYCLNNPLKYVDPQGMQTEPVELPDGTISQPLTDLYNALETALANLSTEQLDEINKLLVGSDADKLQAVMMILEAAGIKFDFNKATNTLSVEFGGVEFFIEFANIREHGKIATGTDTGNKFIVLNNNISKAGDLFLTLGHELVHANMIAFHGDVIDTIKQQYGDVGNEAFNELIAYQWEAGIAEKMWADKDTLRKYVTDEYIGGILIIRNWYQNIWGYIDRGGI
jgi:RHS repeat-associated protein